jgi:putative DNA primase/helicase
MSSKPPRPPVTTATLGRDDEPGRWTSISHPEGRTDVAFGRRFLRDFGDHVLYVPELRTWLTWDGTRWKRDVGECAVTVMAQTVADAIWHEVAKDHSPSAVAYAETMSKPGRWSSALKTVAAAKAVSAGDLDANLWLVTVPNGTIDLRSGELRDHRKEDLLTCLAPTPFVDCDDAEWRAFLAAVFPSEEVREYVQRLFGYAMAGRAARAEEILPVFWGDGSNGKSRFIEAIKATVGSDFATPAAHGLLTEKAGDRHATERASLFGKRLVFSTETGQGAALDEELIKSMTGGDTIKARFCHRDEFEFRPTFTIFLTTNHRPRVKGTDGGIWRRLNLIPFTQRFWRPWMGESGPPETQADPGIDERLQRCRPAILRWLVEGCREWQTAGLNAPEEVRLATAEYRQAEDSVSQFVAEKCLTMPQVRVKFSDFYAAFSEWCEANGDRPPKGRAVSGWLKAHGYQEFKSSGLWFSGIALEA